MIIIKDINFLKNVLKFEYKNEIIMQLQCLYKKISNCLVNPCVDRKKYEIHELKSSTQNYLEEIKMNINQDKSYFR